jgi:hypothetical protein
LPSREVGLALLDQILTSLSQVSFTWHPLGFAHAEICSENDLALRLHLWPKAKRRPQQPFWPIHTHAFHLQSTVLVGTIQNRFFFVNSNQGGSKQLYRVEYRGEGSALLATKVFAEAPVDRIQVTGPGESYEVPIGAFHSSTVPEQALATTLVRVSQHANIQPKVVGTRSGSIEYYYERSLCEQSVVRDSLESVLRGA